MEPTNNKYRFFRFIKYIKNFFFKIFRRKNKTAKYVEINGSECINRDNDTTKIIKYTKNTININEQNNSCRKLQSVVLPDKLESINVKGAFEHCGKLSYMIYPKNIDTIQEKTHHDCISLKRVHCLGSIKEIKDGAFEGCDKLSIFTFLNTNTLKKIGKRAFKYCFSMKKIIIPESVEIIDDDAFYSCSELKELIIKSKKIKFGINVFEKCNKLKIVKVRKEMEQDIIKILPSSKIKIKVIK